MEQVRKETAHKHLDGLLADLAGNAVCGTVMLGVMTATFFSLEWVDSVAESERDLLNDIKASLFA